MNYNANMNASSSTPHQGSSDQLDQSVHQATDPDGNISPLRE